MVKVNSDALSVKVGKSYYEGRVFTGVAVELSGCIVNRAVRYIDGSVDGPYINEYLPAIEHHLIVDFDCLYPEGDEPLCYNEERFSGLAYEFDGDVCVGELIYENGWQDSNVTYYKSGRLYSIELIDNDFSQKYYWYESGQIKCFDLFERNIFYVDLNFNEDGLISTLIINGEYFDRIGDIREDMKFSIYDHKTFPDELKGGDYLYLSGSSVDEDVFDSLLANDGLNHTAKLRICRTPLTIESLMKLAPIKNFVELYVESEMITLKDMQSFKLQRPDCFVEFNRKEVAG